MKKVLVVVIGILLLAGCASVNGQPANEQNPTHTEGYPITSTPEPSRTKTPTTSNTNTKTLVQSTMTLSPTAYPTWNGGIQRRFSPNGDYIAVVYPHGHHDVEKQVLEITDYEDHLIRKIVNNKSQLPGESDMEIVIYGWSADNKVLYYYYKKSSVDQDIIVWWTGYDLRSINVENGYDQAVIPGEGAMSFALSRDESKIIYALASEPAGVIHFLDFETGKNTKIYVDPAPQDFLRVGDFHWSPDGKAIIFQTEADWVGGYKEIGTVHLDAQTFEQKLLHRGGIYTYQFNGWEDDQTLRFCSDEKGHILVNIETGEERLALTGIKTSTPTITLRPTRTITPTISLTPTRTPPLPTYSANPDTMQQGPWITKWSPDGKFLVEIYDYYGHGDIHGPVIEIFDQDNHMLWQIPYEGKTGEGEPYVSMRFLKWSLNGRELYFYAGFNGVPFDYAVLGDGVDVSKIDLYTGEIAPLFPEGSGPVAFSFTEDGGRVVYSIFNENNDTVYIHNFRTGHTMSTVIVSEAQPYDKVGDFHWSPNGQGIIFQTEGMTYYPDIENDYYDIQTVYLNSLTMEYKIIHRGMIYHYMLEDWIDDRTILVSKISEDYSSYGIYAVDIFTEKEILLPEATRAGW